MWNTVMQHTHVCIHTHTFPDLRDPYMQSFNELLLFTVKEKIWELLWLWPSVRCSRKAWISLKAKKPTTNPQHKTPELNMFILVSICRSANTKKPIYYICISLFKCTLLVGLTNTILRIEKDFKEKTRHHPCHPHWSTGHFNKSIP